MKKIGKFLFGCLEFIIITYVVIATACLLNINKYGFTQFGKNILVPVNQTNSAELTDYKSGDLIILNSDLNKIEVGNTVYYYDTYNHIYVIRRGVVSEIIGESYDRTYKIKDSSSIVASEKIMGQVDSVHHGLGLVLDIFNSQLGFLLAVILPIFLLFICQVYNTVLLIKYGDEK